MRAFVIFVPVAVFAALAISAAAQPASNSPATKSTHARSTQTKSTKGKSAQTKSIKGKPVQTKSVHSKSAAAKSSPARVKSTATKSAAAKSTPAKARTSRTASAKSKTKPAARSYRATGPQQPSTDRYREIQQALADRGYFAGPVDGNWGPSSVDALKRFEHDQSLDEDGKIGSLSLIALGLGPKRQNASSATPAPVPSSRQDAPPPPATPAAPVQPTQPQPQIPSETEP